MPRPRPRSPASTTSTWPRTRATSTCTSRSPSGPAARSSSSRSGPAGSPSRWPRPATRSPASTSTRRCSSGRARAPRTTPATRPAGSTLVEARPASSSACRMPARFGLAFIALNSLFLLADARAPSAPRVATLADHLAPGRPRRRRRLAARRGGPGPLRRPDHPRVAAARPGDRARSVTKTGSRALHDAATGTVAPDHDLRGGRPGRAAAAAGSARDRLRLVGRGRAARRSPRTPGCVVEIAGRRLRPRARSGRAASARSCSPAEP